MYRGFVDFGFHNLPDFMTRDRFTLHSEPLKREAVVDKNGESVYWTNLASDFYENCELIKGSHTVSTVSPYQWAKASRNTTA